MSVLEQLEEQPGFPQEDLSGTNAAFISLLLANRVFLGSFHDAAGRAYPIFTGTHKPLWLSLEWLFDDPTNQKAANFGIVAFEAMHLMVGAYQHVINQNALRANIPNILSPKNTEGVRDYFSQANNTFQQTMPRAAHTVAEASERYYDPGRSPFAVLGAAICCEFIRDNTD